MIEYKLKILFERNWFLIQKQSSLYYATWFKHQNYHSYANIYTVIADIILKAAFRKDTDDIFHDMEKKNL